MPKWNDLEKVSPDKWRIVLVRLESKGECRAYWTGAAWCSESHGYELNQTPTAWRNLSDVETRQCAL